VNGKGCKKKVDARRETRPVVLGDSLLKSLNQGTLGKESFIKKIEKGEPH